MIFKYSREAQHSCVLRTIAQLVLIVTVATSSLVSFVNAGNTLPASKVSSLFKMPSSVLPVTHLKAPSWAASVEQKVAESKRSLVVNSDLCAAASTGDPSVICGEWINNFGCDSSWYEVCETDHPSGATYNDYTVRLSGICGDLCGAFDIPEDDWSCIDAVSALTSVDTSCPRQCTEDEDEDEDEDSDLPRCSSDQNERSPESCGAETSPECESYLHALGENMDAWVEVSRFAFGCLSGYLSINTSLPPTPLRPI